MAGAHWNAADAPVLDVITSSVSITLARPVSKSKDAGVHGNIGNRSCVFLFVEKLFRSPHLENIVVVSAFRENLREKTERPYIMYARC